MALHGNARVLPLHDARLPHHADAELLRLQALRERLVGRIDAHAGLLALQQQFLAGLEIVDLAAGGERGADHRVLILDVDDAELVAVLGIEHVLVAGGRGRDDLRIVDADLARIDVADAVGIFHRRQQIAGILELAVVDRQHGAGVVHLEHVERRKALHIGGAARQPHLGEHFRAPLGIAGLVLHHLPAVLDQDRRLDVLVEQAGVVAAPGADDDAALGLR